MRLRTASFRQAHGRAAGKGPGRSGMPVRGSVQVGAALGARLVFAGPSRSGPGGLKGPTVGPSTRSKPAGAVTMRTRGVGEPAVALRGGRVDGGGSRALPTRAAGPCPKRKGPANRSLSSRPEGGRKSSALLGLQNLATAVHAGLQVDVVGTAHFAGILVLDIGRGLECVGGTAHAALRRRRLSFGYSHGTCSTCRHRLKRPGWSLHEPEFAKVACLYTPASGLTSPCGKNPAAPHSRQPT